MRFLRRSVIRSPATRGNFFRFGHAEFAVGKTSEHTRKNDVQEKKPRDPQSGAMRVVQFKTVFSRPYFGFFTSAGAGTGGVLGFGGVGGVGGAGRADGVLSGFASMLEAVIVYSIVTFEPTFNSPVTLVAAVRAISHFSFSF